MQSLQRPASLTDSKEFKGVQRQFKEVYMSCCILETSRQRGTAWLRDNHKNGDKQTPTPEATGGQTRRRAKAGYLPIQVQK